MSLGLTILITCKNEAHNIRDCIASVRGLGDEILVADSGSTDNTLDLVREVGGCRIIQRSEYVSAGNFKNWALPQAKFPWVLVVDSDERVTPELAAEVRQTLASGPQYDCYGIRFQTYFFGREIKRCGWNTTRSIRLFRREVCRYNELRVHADIIPPNGRVGYFQARYKHYTYRSLSRYLERMQRYSYWSAQDKFAAGKRVTWMGVLGRPAVRFFHNYVIRLGFLDGMAGLLICLLTMYYVFLKYALLWEMWNCDVPAASGATLPDPRKSADAAPATARSVRPAA